MAETMLEINKDVNTDTEIGDGGREDACGCAHEGEREDACGGDHDDICADACDDACECSCGDGYDDARVPNILLISGSPRSHTSEYLLRHIEQGARDAGAHTQHFCLSQKNILPCIGCNDCSKTGLCVLASKVAGNRLADDYLELKALMERASSLALIAPLYFAGPPAQLKALLDRLQPYWAQHYVLGQPARLKRPAQLFVVGGGGDKHGYDPLVVIARSALAVAGFSLEKVHNFIGFKADDKYDSTVENKLGSKLDSSLDVAIAENAQVALLETQHASVSLGELAIIKKYAAAQRAFEQRAHDAGSAMARFAAKQQEKTATLLEQRAKQNLSSAKSAKSSIKSSSKTSIKFSAETSSKAPTKSSTKDA